jgi:hypothetical protein
MRYNFNIVISRQLARLRVQPKLIPAQKKTTFVFIQYYVMSMYILHSTVQEPDSWDCQGPAILCNVNVHTAQYLPRT